MSDVDEDRAAEYGPSAAATARDVNAEQDKTREQLTAPHRRLAAVVAEGDYRRSLEALRDYLAHVLPGVDDRSQAPLAKQLADTLAKLQALGPAETGGRPYDEFTARRRKRQSDTAGKARAALLAKRRR